MKKIIFDIKNRLIKHRYVIGLGTLTIGGITLAPKLGPYVVSNMYDNNILYLKTYVKEDRLNIVTKISARIGFDEKEKNYRDCQEGIREWHMSMLRNMYIGNTAILQYLFDKKKVDPQNTINLANMYAISSFVGRCDNSITLDFLKKNDMLRHIDDMFLYTNIKTKLPDEILEIIDIISNVKKVAAIKQIITNEFFVNRSLKEFEIAIDKMKMNEEERRYIYYRMWSPHFTTLVNVTDIKQKLLLLNRVDIGIGATDSLWWIDTVCCCIEFIKMKNHNSTTNHQYDTKITEMQDLLKYLQERYPEKEEVRYFDHKDFVAKYFRDTGKKLDDVQIIY